MGPLALIAGSGSLPRAVCETARDRGVPVVAVAFSAETARDLEGIADVRHYGLGEAEKIISRFRDAGCKKVCLIGKVEKKLAFKKLKVDLRAMKLLGRFIKKDDSSIMLEIIRELEREGFKVVNQTDWLPDLMPRSGVLGKVKPSKQVTADFEYGLDICRQMAGLEIGQTIIVKEGVVLAVEAVEGTNAAIERGCELGGKGAVMIKTARPNQDLRYDIPAVGEETVRLLEKYGAAALGVEAGNVVLVGLPEMIVRCNDAGIALAAL